MVSKRNEEIETEEVQKQRRKEIGKNREKGKIERPLNQLAPP